MNMYQFKVQCSSKNPYDWHKQIWNLFDVNIDKRPFIFAMSNNILYIRSSIKPLISSRRLDVLKFESHKVLKFKVTANVVKTVKRKRFPVTEHGEQVDWINNKIDNISKLTLESPKPLVFLKNNIRGTLNCVTYRGVGKITQELIMNGIGKAKSFGMGMILCKI